MSQSSRWRGRLLDEAGVGRTAFWLVGIPSVIGVLTVLPEGISIPRGLALWALTSVVATGMLGVVFIASAALRSRVHVHARLLPVVVLFTMLIAGAARGIGVVLSFALLGAHESTTMIGRVVSSSVIFTIWLVLIGGFLAALADYRAARQSLLDEIVMRELQMRLFDESRAAGKRDNAAARLSETTAMVRELLESSDMGDAEEYARVSLLLHRAIDERIRPLVHEMWFEPSPEFDAPTSTRGFLRRAYLTPVPLAWAVPLYGVIELPGAFMALGVRAGLAPALAEWAVFALILGLERWVRPNPGPISRTVVMLALLVLPLLGAWCVVGGVPPVPIPHFALFAFMITAPILVFACCAGRAVLDVRGPSLRELQERLQREDWAEQLETLETRAAENSFASVIHNTVQARLLAAALQLETAAMTNDQVRAEHAVEDARSALDATVGTPQVVAARERLRSIAEAWEGIVKVEIAMGAGVEKSASIQLSLDAVEECVANAARHASASDVEVSLRILKGALEITVSDNGIAFESEVASGMGSDWMTRISGGRLTRTRTPAGWNQVRLLLG